MIKEEIAMSLNNKSSACITCFAPKRSLRFDHSGKILACCYNRGNILGEFPKQTIEEVWFGNNLNNLNKALENNDFTLGCQYCEKDIKNNNRAISGAAQYDYLSNHIQHKNYPTMFDFELGSTCNFECIMCSGEYSSAIRKNREKGKLYISPYEEHLDVFIEQLKPFIPHLTEMRFLGGEPFLMNIYYKIWDLVIEMNPKIMLNVLSNGSILNKRVENLLEKGNFKVSVSIDSLLKERYEKIRVNGDFESVLSNAQYFQKFNDRNGFVTNYNLCVMRQNWDEIPDYFNYCNENNIKIVLHAVEFPLHCSIWNLSKEMLNEIYNWYNKNDITDGSTTIEKENKTTYNALKKQIYNWLNREKTAYEEDVFEQFERKIKTAVASTKYKSEINYYHFVTKLIDDFTKEEKIKIIRQLLTMDIQLLIDEINVSSKDRLLERMKLIVNHEI